MPDVPCLGGMASLGRLVHAPRMDAKWELLFCRVPGGMLLRRGNMRLDLRSGEPAVVRFLLLLGRKQVHSGRGVTWLKSGIKHGRGRRFVKLELCRKILAVDLFYR